jgi:hypothetical protein
MTDRHMSDIVRDQDPLTLPPTATVRHCRAQKPDPRSFCLIGWEESFRGEHDGWRLRSSAAGEPTQRFR